ncbi:hypothetical protein VaNZ11_004244, partial [Volvox africanus]
MLAIRACGGFKPGCSRRSAARSCPGLTARHNSHNCANRHHTGARNHCPCHCRRPTTNNSDINTGHRHNSSNNDNADSLSPAGLAHVPASFILPRRPAGSGLSIRAGAGGLAGSCGGQRSDATPDDGAGATAPRRDRCRYPQLRPGVEDTLWSVLKLQSVLAALQCNGTWTSMGSASVGADSDVEGNGGSSGSSRCRRQRQNASGATAAKAAAVQAVSMAARALATVLTNALEVALHPPFAAGLIGASRAAGAGGAVVTARPLDFPLAMYRSSCRLNHSCRPTAAYHFRRGGQISVRLIADLDAGAEVTVSYIDLALPRSRRCAQLRDKYGFECCCERCCSSDSGAPIAVAADGEKSGTTPPASTVLDADQLLSACGTGPLPGPDEPENAGGSNREGLDRVSEPVVKAEVGGRQVVRCIQHSGNGMMCAEGGGADADCSITLQSPYASPPPCKEEERDIEQEHMEGAAGHGDAVSAAIATTTAALAAAEAGLSLEQRLQLLVRDCGDRLLQEKSTSPSDGQLTAEPIYATLIHSLDELLAEAQVQVAVEAEALTAPLEPTAPWKPIGIAGAGAAPLRGGTRGLAFHPQHAACLDAYTLLASAARRSARVATAAAATAAITTPGAYEARARSHQQAQDGARALVGGDDPTHGTVEATVEVRGGGQINDDGASPRVVVPTEVGVVGWWMRAVCASLAGAAAAERLLEADPALLQLAASSWSDAASTVCEMLAALFDTAAATECFRPTAIAVATTATTGSAPDVGVSGTCALLDRVWNPIPRATRQPAQPAPGRSGRPTGAAAAGIKSDIRAAASAVTENGSQSACSRGGDHDSDGSDGAQARSRVTWTRGALVAAVRAALTVERSALMERCPPKQYSFTQSRLREERHHGYHRHYHR